MITKKEIGKKPDGSPAYLFEILNDNGCSVSILELGAIIHSLYVPDKNGKMGDIVLGQDSIEAYSDSAFFKGAVMGRIANFVSNGKFEIDGKEFQLETWDFLNGAMHCGSANYANRFFEGKEEEDRVIFYLYDNGEGGLEVPVHVWVCFEFNESNELCITYKTIPEGDTAVNLTCHAYFNLGNDLTDSVLDHVLEINADYYTGDMRQDKYLGVVHEVADTRNDFRKPCRMGKYLTEKCPSYNTSFAIRGNGFRHAANVYSPESGRMLDVFTDRPGLMFFGAGIDGRAHRGKNNAEYSSSNYFCLETQFFPDSVNISHFPTPIEHAGIEYISKTIYKFSVK